MSGSVHPLHDENFVMPTQSTLKLVDAIAEDAKRIGLATSDDGLRAQVALVRALVDELGHHDPSERRTAALHAQLAEELARLGELIPDGGMHEGPDSVQPLDVLIVDDDESNLSAMAAVVREFGFACRTATSAGEGLREYERQPAAIVISDWNMAGMSGVDLCRALKRDDPHSYVILVTAFFDHAHLARLQDGASAGVDDFLPKPIDVDELEARLRAAERLVRAVRALERVKDSLHAMVAAAPMQQLQGT
jgi:CheY-like chemotaxis protein